MSAFAGSKPALDALEVDRGPDRWLDSLERLRDDLELDRDGARPVHLGRRPVGARGLLHLAAGRVAAAVEQPTGPLAFAGEHTGRRPTPR